MKKTIRLYLFLCLAFIPLTGFSQKQQQDADSLLNRLKVARADTAKASALHALSKYFLTRNPGKAFDYANQLLALAQQHNLKQHLLYAYKDLGGFYYYKSDYAHSKEYELKIIPLAQELNKKAFECDDYVDLASTESRLSDYPAAFAYTDKALAIANEIKDSVLIAKIMNSRGNMYAALSDYPAALDYLFKSLTINEAKKNKLPIAKNYLNIGNLYLMQLNYNKAVYYDSLSLILANKLNDRFLIASSLEQIGEINQRLLKWDTALSYFQRSLSISEELGNAGSIASCSFCLGQIYAQKKDYLRAIELVSKAIDISQKTGNKNSLSIAYGCMGDVYAAKKEYKTAISYLTKSMAIAKDIKQINNEAVNDTKLAACYEAIHDLAAANQCLKKLDTLKNEIINQTTISSAAEMDARFGLDKKEKEIALLTKDKQFQQQKLTFLRNFIVIGLLLIGLLFFFVYRYYHTRQLLKLQTLRTKIASDLHDDIGSTLSSISIFSMIARQESKEVIPLLDQIGEHSRKMLESMADIVWTINPENDNFEKIILRMRSFAFELLGTKNIDFKFNVDEAVTNLKLSMDARKNLFLIFKEATNNLVKYAQADSAVFSIKSSKNHLTMLIRDNGKGFDVQKQTEGNGLKNMKNRAIEIGAKFLIESEPEKGTTIQVLMKTA